MELDPTGKEVPCFYFYFFTTTFTTKLGKNKKKKKKFARCFKNLNLMLRTSKRRIHFYTYQGRKTIVWTYSVLNASYAIILVCDGFYLL